MASLIDSFNKIEKQKLDIERKLKPTSTVNAPSPCSYTLIYPYLPIPDPPEDPLDLHSWLKSPSPNPAPPPQQIPLIPETPLTSPENSLNTQITISSLSLQEL